MDFKVKFDRVEAEKCKVAEQKEKMLKKIVEEQTFLNTAIKAAESSEFTSISGLQQIIDNLNLKRDQTEDAYKKKEEEKDAEMLKLTQRLKLEELKIRDAVGKMDQDIMKIIASLKTSRFTYKKFKHIGPTDERQVSQLIGQMTMSEPLSSVKCKQESRFNYKKLDLAGYTEDYYKSKYFESISEEDFSKVLDKDHFGIQSLKLSKLQVYQRLAGIEVVNENGMISKHLGQTDDSRAQFTISLKDFAIGEIKVIKLRGKNDLRGFKFVSHTDATSVIDTTLETHKGLSADVDEESYAKLAENQKLIGVYGYFYTCPIFGEDQISSLGFIVKEQIDD